LPKATCITAPAPATCVLPPATCTNASAPPVCVLPPATCTLPVPDRWEYTRNNVPNPAPSIAVFPEIRLNGSIGVNRAATLHTPRGAGLAAPFPLNIILSGTAGSDQRNRDYAFFDNQAGVATMQIDMYGTRNRFQGGGIPDRLKMVDVIQDAYSALDWAVNARTATGGLLFDPKRIGIRGFSIGGVGCMLTAAMQYASKYANRFAAHQCMYPLQHRLNNASWPGYEFVETTGARIQIHIGDLDAYDSTPTVTVADTIRRFRDSLTPAVAGTVRHIVYKNSLHSFDRQSPPPTPQNDVDACLGGGCLSPLDFNPVTTAQSIADSVSFFKAEYNML